MKLRFKHSGASGDILYSLPAIQKACENYDAEAILFIKIGAPNLGSNPNFKHAYGDVMLNDYAYKMLKPLLMQVPFIYDVMAYTDQKIDFDLDKFRSIGMNLSAYDIKRWYALAYPELTGIDYSQPLIQLDSVNGDYIVVNRTERYQNPNIDYRALNDSKRDIYFTGTNREYEEFNKIVPCIHKNVNSFLELAQFINDSHLFIGNQSMNFAIAETLKCNRALEICYQAPNVIPSGGNYFEMWDTNGLINAIQ